MHHWPPQAVGPQTIFLAASGNIGGRINKGWVLSTEPEKHRARIFCGRFHDDLANLRHCRWKKMKSKGSLSSSVTSSLLPCDGRNSLRIEVFRNEIQQDLAGGRQTLGEFENARICPPQESRHGRV